MLRITNPATGELLQEVQEDTAAAIREKAERARAAQPAFAALPLETRIAMLAKFKELVAANQDRLAKILTSEVGKPIKQSQNELNALAGRISFFLDETKRTLATEKVFDESGMVEEVRWEPLGVIANISAWNYPYFVGSNVFVPALLAGNAVLYKPSEFATLTGQAIGELLFEAGVPRDVFQVIVGAADVGKTLLEQKIDGVFFTGSYNTGKKIAEAVAGRLIKVQLELGGKDPTYVADDADPKVAAGSLADGAMYNAGQSCCSVERIYVHEKVADAFISAFLAEVRGFVVGSPMDETTYIGPLARAPQLGVLEAQVKDAVAKGAKVLVGGKRIDRVGNYFEPTVLTSVTNEMAVMREESFGPIIGIQTVKSDEEAVALMNDTDYGLTSGVFTKDAARADRILSKIDSGSVYWNCCDRVSPRLPWTGRRGSGIGSTLGTVGIRAFVQPKAWHRRAP